MAKTKIAKKKVTSAGLLEKPKPKKARPKVKRLRGLSNAELRELMKTNKPPQSWYDEDHTGMY
jgi:hypothetical protein